MKWIFVREMKRLLKYIASKAKKRTTFEQSEEFQFFLDNRHYLTRLPKFSAFYEPGEEPFNVIRANVILYSYINKMTQPPQPPVEPVPVVKHGSPSNSPICV